MALLELNDVVAGYGPTTVLHGVSLSVDEGGIVALLGANGAGKTTTLRAISSTVRRTGRVVFDGHDISSHAPENVARLGIAHVPEGRGTLGQLTVWENLQMGAYIRRGGVAKADYDRVCEYFAWIPERRRQVAATLSGGEQQMLGLALGLVLIYRAMDVANFAQGEMATFSTFISYSLIEYAHFDFWSAFVVTILVSFGLGVAIERLLIRRFEGAPVLTLLIVTLGLFTIF